MSKSPKILLIAALMLATPGCRYLNPLNWFSDDETEEPAELQDIEQTVSMRRAWSAGVGNGQGDKFNRLVPVVDGERIYAASADGDVVALETVSGDLLWRTRTRETITGAVGAGSGLVMVGTEDAEVLVLDANDGEMRWRRAVSSEIVAPPQTNGDVVVLQTVDDKLIALDAGSGEQRWSYEANLPALTLRGTSTPVFSSGAVIAGFSNGTLVAVSADSGIWRWEERVAVPQGRYDIDRVIDVDGELLLAGTVVLAASYQGNLMGFDIQTGRIVWGMEGSTYHGLAQGFGNLYTIDERSHLLAIRNNSNNIVWRNEDLDLRELTAPTIIGNYVAVADFEGYVHLVSQVDGSIVGRTRVDNDGIRARLVASGNTLYAYGNSGRLVALTIQ